jgi:hypothetical protein
MSDVVRESQRHNFDNQRDLSGAEFDFFAGNNRGFNKQAYAVSRNEMVLTNLTLGSTVEVALPDGFIGSAHLETTWAGPGAGTYCNLLGMAVVDTLRVRGAKVLCEFDHRQALKHIYGKLESNEQNLLVELSGGATGYTGNSTIVTPLLLPWSPWVHGLQYVPQPIDNRFGSKLNLRIGLVGELETLAVGGNTPALSECKLIYYTYTPDADVPPVPVYHGVGYQTIRSQEVASAAEANIDISALNRVVSEIGIQCSFVTDWTTAHEYFEDQADINQMVVRLAGRKYFELSSKAGALMDGMVLAGAKANSLGQELIVPFGGAGDSLHHHTGGLNASHVYSMVLTVKHASGASSYIDVVAKELLSMKVTGSGWEPCE